MGNVGNKGMHWLPQQYMHNPQAGVVEGATMRDVRDLFEYGFQFVNWDAANLAGAYKANNMQFTRLDGTVGPDGVYPIEAQCNAQLWKAAAANNVRQDGKLNLNILTDLPPDMNVGDAASQDVVAVEEDTDLHEFETLDDLATEYVAKLAERKAGNLDVKLPNIRSALSKIVPKR
jgi:hypothetical protein